MNARERLARDLCAVPLFSRRQAIATHARGDPANFRKLVRGSPWFETVFILGKHWTLDGPIAVWKPGDPPMDYGAISYRAMTRWKSTPTEPMTCIRASRRAHGLFGGKPTRLGTSAAHHLGVAGIYLALRERGEAGSWRLEDARFTPQRAKRPDAYLGTRLIDFAGCYGAGRIRELHELAVAAREPLEIW